MRFNAVNDEKVMENGEHLGAKVATSRGADDDIVCRLGKARAAIGILGCVVQSPIKQTQG